MLDDVLSDPIEMGKMAETTVYKHVAAFYYREQTKVGYYRQGGKNDKEIKKEQLMGWRGPVLLYFRGG